MGKDLKVAAVASVTTFLIIIMESYIFGNQLPRLSQLIVISIGVGFTTYLAMNSWFKDAEDS